MGWREGGKEGGREGGGGKVCQTVTPSLELHGPSAWGATCTQPCQNGGGGYDLPFPQTLDRADYLLLYKYSVRLS